MQRATTSDRRDSRSHWKDSHASDGRGASGRRAKKWFATLASLGLVALLIYVMWPPQAIRPHFAVVRVSQFESLLPPLVHAERDVEAFSRLQSARFSSFQTLSGGTTAKNLLGDKLSELSGEALILYVLTHGLTVPSNMEVPSGADGSPAGEAAAEQAGLRGPTVNAVLIGSSSQSDVGGVDVAAVLAAANECPAQTKLLVLDVARIATLPQEGMFANEMAHYLDQELKRKDDRGENVYADDVWVLLPNGLMESATMDAQRSAFAQAFEEALRGEADGILANDADHHVTVGEAYSYVRNQLHGGLGPQTVLLFRGGTGALSSDEASLSTSPRLVSVFEAVNEPETGPGSDSDAGEAEPKEADTKVQTVKAVSQGEPDAPSARPSAGGPEQTGTEQSNASARVATSPADGPAPEGSVPPEGAPEGQDSVANAAAAAADGAATTTPAPPEEPPPPPFWQVQRTPDAKSQSVQQQLDAELDRAWKLHADLLARRASDGWSPIDFAPHLWRSLESQLVAWERDGVLVQPPDDVQSRVLREVTAHVDWLSRFAEALGTGRSGTGAIQGTPDAERLFAAWNWFLQEAEAESSSWNAAKRFITAHAGTPSSNVDAVQARMASNREFADLVYAAAEYVALFDAACACGVAPDQLGQFSRDLSDYLSQLRLVLEALRQPVAAASSIASPTAEAIAQLQRLARHRDLLARSLEPLQRAGAMSVDAAVALRKTNVSPAMTANLAAKPSAVHDAVHGDASFREISILRRDVYQRYLELAQSETELPELRPAAAAGGQSGEFLIATRAVGLKLREGFATLLQDVKDSADGEDAFLAAHRARLLDTRTIRTRANEWGAREQVFGPLKVDVPNALIVSRVPSTLGLDFTEPREVAIDVGLFGPLAATSQAVVNFNEDLLAVRHAGASIRDGHSIPLRAGNNQLVVEATAQRPQPGSQQATFGQDPETEQITRLSISFEGERQHVPVAIECVLPLERPLLLTVDQEGDAPARRPLGSWSDPISLRPLPNRSSTFQFTLQNRSGEARTVDLSLFPAKRDLKLFRQLALQSGRSLPADEYRRETLGSAPLLLGELKGLTIAGGGASQSFHFSKKSVEAPAAAGGAESASAAANPNSGGTTGANPGDASGAAPIDVSNGLVCVVRDATNGREWLYFLEMEPLAPNRFLRASAQIRQLGRSRVLEIAIEPIRDVPGLSDESPILVAFNRVVNVAGRQNLLPKSQITPQGPAVLRFGIDDETQWRVLVDVGGKLGEQKEDVYYERAFDLLITSQGGQLVVRDGRNDRREVRLDSLAVIDTQGNESRAFRGGEELQNTAFAITDAPPTITVRFHVDAPPTAFDRYTDRIVLMARDRTLFEAHADRRHMAQVVDVGKSGLVLEARVEDFSYQWRPQESNAEVPLRLALVLAGETLEQQDVAPVKLDAQPPTIRFFGYASPGPNVPAGRIAVQLVAMDQWSGISKVEVARNTDLSAPFGEGDPRPELTGIDSAWDAATGQFHWQAILPADIAKPGEKIRLIARVFDGVGHESQLAATDITMPSPTVAAEQRGTIWGQVAFNGRPEKAIAVDLTGPSGTLTEKLDAQNRYFFRDLPAGTYSIRVETDVVLQVAGRKTIGDERPGVRLDPKTAKNLRVDLNLEEIR